MKLPDKIKLGNNYFNIKRVKSINWMNDNIAGNINYGSRLIKVKRYKDNAKIEGDVFFHEVAHGILKELEYNYPKISFFRNNETFVQEMGLVLRKLYVDLLDNRVEE